MKAKSSRRSILHVELAPFFVAVERSLDPALKGVPVIVGSDAGLGLVAAASDEARAAGVVAGMALAVARRLCPSAAVRRGDFESYAQVSDEVTSLLLGHSRRVERPSADEAYVDLTPEGLCSPHPVTAAESIKDDLQRRLGLDASLGVGTTRIAARVASSAARPRGLLVVLPGYEASFLARQDLESLSRLTPSAQAALKRSGVETLGDLLDLEPERLLALLGPLGARLREEASGESDAPILVATPPNWIQEEVALRVKPANAQEVEGVLEALVERAARRLKPFSLRAGMLSVELKRGSALDRRSTALEMATSDARSLATAALGLIAESVEPASGVRGLGLRLTRLSNGAQLQAVLFPPPGRVAR